MILLKKGSKETKTGGTDQDRRRRERDKKFIVRSAARGSPKILASLQTHR